MIFSQLFASLETASLSFLCRAECYLSGYQISHVKQFCYPVALALNRRQEILRSHGKRLKLKQARKFHLKSVYRCSWEEAALRLWCIQMFSFNATHHHHHHHHHHELLQTTMTNTSSFSGRFVPRFVLNGLYSVVFLSFQFRIKEAASRFIR